jgi:hypothetical protein
MADPVPPTSETSLRDVLAAAAKSLKDAVEGFVDVQIVTAVGPDALCAELQRAWNNSNKEMRVDLTLPKFADASGAVSRINMASGDISQAISNNFLGNDALEKLHADAVKQGTDIFRANIRLLHDLVTQLFDKTREKPPG